MDDHFDIIIARLREQGIGFAPGLSDSEVERVQERFGFLFPPDLRQFLQRAMPTSSSIYSSEFPNWRDGNEESLRETLAWPLEGMQFDIERNNFWRKDWGKRPDTLADAFGMAREAVHAAPTLIPIYAHRYIPDRPHQSGNPIFSVHQTDIIFYGYDLPSYFAHEFGIDNPRAKPEDPRPIEFWSWFTDYEEPPLTLERAEEKIKSCRSGIELWKRLLENPPVPRGPLSAEQERQSFEMLLARYTQSLREWEQKRRDLLSSSSDATST